MPRTKKFGKNKYLGNKSQHELCPKGEETWCTFQKSVNKNETYTHKNSIPEAVMTTIKPIFQDLSNEDLVKKCQHGRSQNPNESFNNMVWSRIPKNVFVGLHTLKLGVMDAIITFNSGALGKVKILQTLCGDGSNCVIGLKSIDEMRAKEAKKAMEEIVKKARQKKRNLKRKRGRKR